MCRTNPLVYLIGDSISIHYGAYLEKYLAGSWRYARKNGEAEALLNLDNPQGANGGDSSMVLAFLREKVKDPQFFPALLLFNCGLHDIKTNPATKSRQVPLAEYERNLREILRVIREAGLVAAWIRTTHVNETFHNSRVSGFQRFAADHAAYNEVADHVMTDLEIPVADLCGFTRNLGADEELFCDHVHFFDAIREKQAAFLSGWLEAYRNFL